MNMFFQNVQYIASYTVDLLPVLISLGIMASVLLWVGIKNHKNWLLMFLLIPLTIGSSWTIYSTVDKLLGYPTVDFMDKQSLYLSHIEQNDQWINVWIIKNGEQTPKAIKVPNTENNRKELQEAAEKKENGVETHLKQKSQPNPGTTQGGEIETYDFVDTAPPVSKKGAADRNNINELPGRVLRPSTPPRPPTAADRNRAEEFTRQEVMPGPVDDLINPFIFGEEFYEDGPQPLPNESHNPYAVGDTRDETGYWTDIY
jgi:hypothetical protein